MKLKSAIIALFLIFIFTCSASAATTTLADGKISVTLPDNYIGIENTDSNISKNAEFISTLGHSTDSFRTYLTHANILYFAATSDNTKQIQIKSWTTEFSKEIGNLALFSDDEDSLTKASQTLAAEGEGETLKNLSRVTRSDGTLFIKIQKLVSGQKDFSYLQYVSIIDGQYYSLVYYNFGGEFTDEQLAEADRIFASLSIEQKTSISLENSNNILNIALLWIAIAVISVFVIILLFTLLRDLFRRRAKKHRSFEKIERRKF